MDISKRYTALLDLIENDNPNAAEKAAEASKNIQFNATCLNLLTNDSGFTQMAANTR